ncbi:MAG: amidohydrolase/deacetylase family metallohydrolase, partial [Thermomicrobiales bacterium]
RMTINPARALNHPELGRLEVGGVGDATVLRIEEGRFPLNDVDGRIRWTNRRLIAQGSVRAGVYTHASSSDNQ